MNGRACIPSSAIFLFRCPCPGLQFLLFYASATLHQLAVTSLLYLLVAHTSRLVYLVIRV